jgi:hypothetical protein
MTGTGETGTAAVSATVTGAAAVGAAEALHVTAAALAALQAALAAEHAACYGYGVTGAHLAGASAASASADWVAHQLGRDKLAAMISAAGATPVPAAVAYQLPAPVHSAGQARALAALLENDVAQAYLGLVGLTDPALRQLGAAGLRAAALRAAAWTGQTVAFPGLPGGSLGGTPGRATAVR